VFWELKNGKKLRMLQTDAGSPALSGDIKWQQQTSPVAGWLDEVQGWRTASY